MLISIGVPFHNDHETILASVQSVVAQSFQDWELILVDDCSEDDSARVIAQIKDDRIRLVRNEQNLGLAGSLNRITELAQGEYIARMDADDVMHPERLQRQLDFLKSNPDVDILGTSMYSIDQSNTVTGLRAYSLADMTPRKLLSHAHVVHPSVLGRADWFRRNPYDADLRRAQDHELWVRTFAASRIVNLNEPLIFVREAGTVTAGKYIQSSRAVRRIIRRYGPDLLGRMGTLRLVAESYGKELIYRVAEPAGVIDRLVNDRNQRLPMETVQFAQQTLDEVLATPLPGIPVADEQSERAPQCV